MNDQERTGRPSAVLAYIEAAFNDLHAAEQEAEAERRGDVMRASTRVWGGKWKPKAGRKLKRDEMQRTVTLCFQVKAASDRLRAAAELPLVPLSPSCQAWIAELERSPAPRAHKSNPARVDVAPLDRVKQATSAIAAGRVAQLEAAREAVEQGASYAAIGRALGVSRQAAHKMLTLAGTNGDGGS